MQALYALKQAEIANQNAGYDYIRDFFTPDLNANEAQDHKKLDADKKKASRLYEDYFRNGRLQVSEAADLQKVVEAAVQGYVSQCTKDRKHYSSVMMQDVDHVYDEYLMCLYLMQELSVAMQADMDKKHRTDEKVDYSRFLTSAGIIRLQECKEFQQMVFKKNISWPADQVKTILKEGIRNDEAFLAYLAVKTKNEEEDIHMALHMVKDLIMKNKYVVAYFEDMDLNWVENKNIVKSMVAKTIKTLLDEPAALKLLDISANWEEDKAYFKDLYDNTVSHEKELEVIVVGKVKNWDLERIALVDYIILKLAIAEMLYCPNIPVKVSINEYIELSKNYSTPKSKQFVNGLLDVIAEDLQKTGKIKKSGKGLIDNK
jgi:N utilization substance protein B